MAIIDGVECPFCGGHFREFLPAGLSIPVLKEKQVIGGGYRANAVCPCCQSLDRERLVYLYLKSKTGVFHHNVRLLHIAPEKRLQEVLAPRLNIEYHSVDTNSPLATVRMSATDLGYQTSFFDVIICNHVLEHIPNDRKAMSELHRVLKPGGWAILQVPISMSLRETYEDSTVTAPLERERLFGQNDHVRIYARDYRDRLEAVGFAVRVYSYTEEFGEFASRKYGLNIEENLYISCKLI
jgi:predicted SAM-dependent methyltransferase